MTDIYLYMEDVHIGQKFAAGPVIMHLDDIIRFARAFDPQDFHTDVEKAKDSSFGELVASGWHTAAVTMRMITEATPKMKGGMIGRNVSHMNWPRPVRPGDALSYEGEILDVRASASNPKRGLIRVKNITRNQNGEIVLESETLIFIPRR